MDQGYRVTITKDSKRCLILSIVCYKLHTCAKTCAMKKHYTIKDIAEELNLHHTTVSRALRNHPDVSEETRDMVLRTATKHNYIPNSFAKSLRIKFLKLLSAKL